MIKSEKEKRKQKRRKTSINHNQKGPYDSTAEGTYTAAKTSEKNNPGPVKQFILRTTMKMCGIT